MNYVNKLEQFIDRYEIIKKLVYSTEEIINEVIFNKLSSNDKVAIWALGEHTTKLLKVLNTDKLNIVCFVDRAKGKDNLTIMGKKVIDPSVLQEYAPDTIIISSYSFRKEIGEYIRNFYPNCKTIDIYDEYDFGAPFYDNLIFMNFKMYAVTIPSMYSDLVNMGYSINDDIKQKILKILEENDLVYEFNAKGSCFKPGVASENTSKIKVDFFLQIPQGWTSLESVWKAFREDDRFEARIIQVPYINNRGKEFNDDIRNFLISRNLPFIPWYFYDIDAEKPAIVFFQNPYDVNRPPGFHASEVCRKTRAVYVPYGLEIGGGNTNYDRQFNLFLQNNAWLICSRSLRNKNMYKKYCRRGDENVIVTGHPKLDAIYNLDKFAVDEQMARIVAGKKVFLWNPHFRIDDFEEKWSTFNKFKDAMLDIFEKREDAFLIIRPHPILLENMKTASEEIIPGITRFKNRINNMANVYFDTMFDYRHSFALSDALLSDASSFLLEYLPTQKPIVYLRNNEGPGLNDDGDIVNYYYVADTQDDIEKYVDMIIRGQDPMKETRLAKIEEYLYIIDGQAGKRIKEAVANKYLMETGNQ